MLPDSFSQSVEEAAAPLPAHVVHVVRVNGHEADASQLTQQNVLSLAVSSFVALLALLLFWMG